MFGNNFSHVKWYSIIAPAPWGDNKKISKLRQYIFSIPASKMNSQRGKTK
jgi:hypothetical protein